MVVVSPHLRLSWGGTLGTPATEVWTNSLNFTGVTDAESEGFTYADMVSTIDNMADVVKLWFASKENNYGGGDAAHISTSAALTWVKWNKIGANGKYLDNPNTLTFAPVTGQGGAQQLWQQSSVISLLTGATRGRGSRGRIYPPACGVAPGTDGYMDAATSGNMTSAAVTLIGNLNKVVTNELHVGAAPRWNACIVSASVRGLPPLLTPITRVYVDRVPDVQRRRVDRLPIPGVAPTNTYINT